MHRLALTAAAPLVAEAQEASPRTRVWLDVGPATGAGGGLDDAGLGFLTQLSVQRRPYFFALRSAGLLAIAGPHRTRLLQLLAQAFG